MDTTQLTELKNLCEAATPGPWLDNHDHVDDSLGMPLMRNVRGFEHLNCADFAFVSAARQAVPELLAYIDRLRMALKPFAKTYVLAGESWLNRGVDYLDCKKAAEVYGEEDT